MIIHYEALRGDWIKGADLLARLIVKSSKKGAILEGFPRQWIPIFLNFGASWQSTVPPSSFIPVVSDVDEQWLVDICMRARREGALRTLVEAFASLDPLLADVLYRLDRRVVRADVGSASYIPLTGWQSYGRPEVLVLVDQIVRFAQARMSRAVLLPCARKRPYEQSKTHRRIWRALEKAGIRPAFVDKIVVSSIGIVPEEFWNHPVVVAYDSGVPDIYRILRLMRQFFQKTKYSTVFDCLEFKPYSDCLRIVEQEGLIEVVRIETAKRLRPLPKP